MKKFLTNFFALALSGAMCLGFAACGDEGNEIEAEAKDFESARVSAEQWDAAFAALQADDAKYAVEFSCSFEYEVTEKKSQANWKVIQTAIGQFVWSGEKAKLIVEESTAKTESELEEGPEGWSEEDIAKVNFSNAEYFIAPGQRYEQDLYEQNDEGQWVRHSIESAGGDNGYRGLPVFLQHIVRFSNSFDWLEGGLGLSYEAYSFSEEQKGYYGELPADSDLELFYWHATIKFDQDGKLAALLVDLSDKDWGGVVTYKINFLFKDSTEEITLPTVDE